MGLEVEALVQVTLERHAALAIDAFTEELRKIPNVVQCVSLTGQYDAQLRVLAPSIAAFEQILMTRLMKIPGVRIVGTAGHKAAVLSFVVTNPPLSALGVGTKLDLEGVAVRHGTSPRRRPHAIEQALNGFRRLRHGVVETIMRKGRIADEPRPLGAQRDRLGDDRLVVGCAAAIAADYPGLVRLFPQVAPRRGPQKRLDTGPRQRDRMLVRQASLRRRRPGRRAGAFAQAGEVILALEHQRVSLLVGQHVLAEGGAERGQPLADRRNPAFRIGRQPCPGAAESDVVALQNPPLFRRKAADQSAVGKARRQSHRHPWLCSRLRCFLSLVLAPCNWACQARPAFA